MGDFFKNLPWWIKVPAGLVGAAMNQYSNKLPDWAGPYGEIAGAALALWVVLAFLWHGVNAWRQHKQKPRLKLEPSHVIILGLAIALCAVIWHSRRAPLAPSAAATPIQGHDIHLGLKFGPAGSMPVSTDLANV